MCVAGVEPVSLGRTARGAVCDGLSAASSPPRRARAQFTVELRTSELLAADYLITCKRWGESTRFSILRAGEPREFSTVLAPLPHHMPRASGFDCEPTYAILGGLVFVPLCCPMFDYKEHKHVSQQARPHGAPGHALP